MSTPANSNPSSSGGLPPRGPAWRRWLLVWVAWSIPALASLASTLNNSVSADQAGMDARDVLRNTFFWGVYALLTPTALWLAWRIPLRGDRLRSRMPLHLVACVVFAVSAGAVMVTASLFIDAEAITVQEWQTRFRQSVAFLPMSGLFYWIIVMVGSSIDNVRIARSQRERAAVLERQLAEARLHALKGQIQPHFLFNTLNSIASLVRQGANDRALDMINRLGALLRQTLRDADARPVPLQEELEFIEQYLAIEQTRLGDRLRVRYDIADAAREVPVPSLLVQPLVENAIRHGIAPEPDGGELVISAHVRSRRLEIRVTNDGATLDTSESGHDVGIGLRNIRARIEAAYNSRGSLDVQPRSGGGAVATLIIPGAADVTPREHDA